MNIVTQIFNSERLSEIGSYTAIKWQSGSWTYLELFEWIQFASSVLKDHGLKAGERVVFQCSDTAILVSFYLAALHIGAVAVAVSTRLNIDELKYVLEDSDARVLIYDSRAEKTCRELLEDQNCNLVPILLDNYSVRSVSFQLSETASRSAQDEALWVYSSGSTSKPKGIVHTHRDFTNCCDFHANTLETVPGNLLFCTSRISFAYALANGLLVPLRLGATVYLHPEWVKLDDVRSIVAREKPKAVFSVPSIFRGLLDEFDSGSAQLFSEPQHYISAGEHLPAEIQDEWKRRTGRTIINAYGCSETLFLAFAGEPSETPPSSVGKPLYGVKTRLVNGKNVLADDSMEKAILYISHPYMFTHYANRDQDTAEKLVSNYFITGDLYRRDSKGNWYHMGREDELIKVSGQWVYLREIEKAAMQSDVAFDVVVVGAADEIGMLRPALFFVPVSDVEIDDAAIQMKQHVEQNLPRVKYPSWIRVLEEFPRTANGKISRNELQVLVEGSIRD